MIVGVGDEDFTEMEILDGDGGPLVSSDGLEAKRDIVQFVEYSKVCKDNMTLTSSILEEVPWQLCTFYKVNEILPENA